IRKTYANKVKVIEEIEIIELFQDRALGILRTVKNLEQDESREFNISVPTLCLGKKLGRLSRIPYDNTSDWWTRIKVTEEKLDEETKTGYGRTIRKIGRASCRERGKISVVGGSSRDKESDIEANH